MTSGPIVILNHSGTVLNRGRNFAAIASWCHENNNFSSPAIYAPV